jgi:hypothetical protein
MLTTLSKIEGRPMGQYLRRTANIRSSATINEDRESLPSTVQVGVVLYSHVRSHEVYSSDSHAVASFSQRLGAFLEAKRKGILADLNLTEISPAAQLFD